MKEVILILFFAIIGNNILPTIEESLLSKSWMEELKKELKTEIMKDIEKDLNEIARSRREACECIGQPGA